MHLENKSCATSALARCAGLATAPTNLTPPPPGADRLVEDRCLPDVLGLEMLATLETPSRVAAAGNEGLQCQRAREAPPRRADGLPANGCDDDRRPTTRRQLAGTPFRGCPAGHGSAVLAWASGNGSCKRGARIYTYMA